MPPMVEVVVRRPAAGGGLGAGRRAAEEGAEEVAEAGQVLADACGTRSGRRHDPVERRRTDRRRRPGRRHRSAGALVGLPVGAQLVVGLALLGVAEDLVGLVDLLEALSAAGALVDVRMVLARKLPEGLLDVGLAGRPRDAEGRVVVAGTPSRRSL